MNTDERVAQVIAATSSAPTVRPRCRRIDIEFHTDGYFCRNCGYSLIETSAKWFRHGSEWRRPDVWTNPHV